MIFSQFLQHREPFGLMLSFRKPREAGCAIAASYGFDSEALICGGWFRFRQRDATPQLLALVIA